MPQPGPIFIDIAWRVDAAKVPVTEDDLRRAVALAVEAVSAAGIELSLALVGDEEMHVLNREYLGHDYTTDVLSFDYRDDPEADVLEGEVVVCVDVAAREAVEHGSPPRVEVLRYVVHGVLHIAGYDDAEEDDRLEMWALQEQVLAALQGDGADESQS